MKIIKTFHFKILNLSNVKESGTIAFGPQMNHEWHQDGLSLINPCSYSGFHCHISSKYGNTYFANLNQAYNIMDNATKEYFESLASIHTSGVVHPLVYEHPDSKLKCVSLHLVHTVGIIQK